MTATAVALLTGVGASSIDALRAQVAEASSGPLPVCGGGMCTLTFTPTGSFQTLTVPDGVTSFTVTVEGAAAQAFLNAGVVDGGMSSGTLSTTPGTTYGVLVGQLGSAATDAYSNATGGAAVSGGGGSGGNAPDDGSGEASLAGGGGGGGSFVFTAGGTALLVAGGAGGNAGSVCQGGVGGGAGAAPGAGGSISSGYSSTCTIGGGAATTGSPGTAGAGAVGGATGTGGSGPAAGGLPGAGGNGGAGSTTSGDGSGSGGGGGGGYYGGGGGGGAGDYSNPHAGAGGGGAGYAAAGLTNVSGSAGVNGGAGIVTFTYTAPTDMISFNSEGGTAVSSVSGQEGSTITLPDPPSYPGYGFDGWFTSPAGGVALTSPYTVSGATTLYAQWTPVVPLGQAIGFTPPASGTVGGSATLSATGGASGLPVTFSLDPSTSPLGACTVSGNVVSYLLVGSCTIDANQAGNANYSPAAQVKQTIRIGAVALAVVNPTLTGRVSSVHPKTRYGWYRSAVTVSFVCTTGSAPLTAACPGDTILTVSRTGQEVSGIIHATDGGSATAVISGINIDRTPPTVKVTGVTNGATYRSVRHLICKARDALSGLAKPCTIRAHRTASTVTYTATATDKAGNTRKVAGHYRLRG